MLLNNFHSLYQRFTSEIIKILFFRNLDIFVQKTCYAVVEDEEGDEEEEKAKDIHESGGEGEEEEGDGGAETVRCLVPSDRKNV